MHANRHPSAVICEFVYSVDGTVLEKVDESKNLRVIMNDRMSFLPHFEAINSKSSRMLGFIKRLVRKFHDPYTPKTMNTSLVRPILEQVTCI
jgi:hypothetical protein